MVSRPLRVLMAGPALNKMGGIAAIEQLYLSNWNHSRYEVRHVPTVKDGSALGKVLLFARALVRAGGLFAFWKPDIVHAHVAWRGSFFRMAIILSLARLFGVKTIFHCNANRFDVFFEKSHALVRKFILLILRKSDLVLTVSPQWHAYFQSICPSAHLAHLSNPVHVPDLYLPDMDRSAPIVLTLGRLGQRKGTYDTLQAIPLILERCPDAQFWFGGDGEITKVKSLLVNESWRDHVRVMGWVQGQQKERALRTAAVFLLPSYHEGQPVAILEAMAYALPVVSTSIGGIPEAVADGRTGYLVTPGDIHALADRVSTLLADETLRAKMGDAGRNRVIAQFDVRQILERLYAIYDELLDNSNASDDATRT